MPYDPHYCHISICTSIPSKEKVAVEKKVENRVTLILGLIILAVINAVAIYYIVMVYRGGSIFAEYWYLAVALLVIIDISPILAWINDRMKKRKKE